MMCSQRMTLLNRIGVPNQGRSCYMTMLVSIASTKLLRGLAFQRLQRGRGLS